MTGSLEDVAAECQRIGDEATALGLEHFGAIGRHNAGAAFARLGRFDAALATLEQAARFWENPPTSPFADNFELVLALLALGKRDRARRVAAEAVQRTSPWPRPQANALCGLAEVHISDGQFAEAISAMEMARVNSAYLGGLHFEVNSRLIEALFLAGRLSDIPRIALELTLRTPDPRHIAEAAAARALGTHVQGQCSGECLAAAEDLDLAEGHGGVATAASGRVKLSVLALAHGGPKNQQWAWRSVFAANDLGLWHSLRPWLRLFTPHARSALKLRGGAAALASLAAFDPDGWRTALIDALSGIRGSDRAVVLDAIGRTANRETLHALAAVEGDDVMALRRKLRFLQAPRLFLRTLGGIALHRAGWDGPTIVIEKKRVRMLLAVLAAHSGTSLTRDAALEILWPDADPDSAVNSLNQTVFQLRRYIDRRYKGGESAEYVQSTSDHVGLHPELVHTDLAEIRRLPSRLASADWHGRQNAAARAIHLVRGEFLSDLRYEEWVTRQQLGVHSEIRDRLLPIAKAAGTSFDVEVSAHAATALLNLDPFDEEAVLALADCLTQSGRRAAARKVVVDFLKRLESDLQLEPTPGFNVQVGRLGVKPVLTKAGSNYLLP